MPTLKKDPNSTLDYTFDWEAWLTPLGVSIASVSWVLSSGLTQVATANTLTTATVYVSGGVAGSEETITCRITTTGATPRVEDRSVTLRIVQR